MCCTAVLYNVLYMLLEKSFSKHWTIQTLFLICVFQKNTCKNSRIKPKHFLCNKAIDLKSCHHRH